MAATALAVSAVAQPTAAGQTAAVTPAPVNQRLVPNADFETTPTKDVVPNWTPVGGHVSTKMETSTNRVVEIASVDATQESAKSEMVAVMPGEYVKASALAKHISGGAGTLRIQFYDSNRAYLTTPSGHEQVDAGTTAGWLNTSVDAYAPDKATFATVSVVNRSPGTNDWDNVTITTTPPSKYLVPDAGFEETRPNTANSAHFWSLSGGAAIGSDPAYAWDARQYLRLNDAEGANSIALGQKVPVNAGTTVALNVMARRLSGTTGKVALRFFDASGGTLAGPSPVSVPTVVAGWQPMTITGTAPAGTAAMDAYIYATAEGAGTTLYDSIHLVPTSPTSTYDANVSTGTMLFVGDQRVETATGLSRVVHPGTKSTEAIAGQPGTVVGRSGLTSRTVLKSNAPAASACAAAGAPLWRMWSDSQMLESSSPTSGWPTTTSGPCVHDSIVKFTTNLLSACPSLNSAAMAPAAIISNPQGGYWGLAMRNVSAFDAGFPDDDPKTVDCDHTHVVTSGIYSFSSPDGYTWTQASARPVFTGRDTVNVVKVGTKYRAYAKQWSYSWNGAGNYEWQPRSVYLSESSDFASWSTPTFSLSSDVIDMQNVEAKFPSDKYPAATPLSDIYQVPVGLYGDQQIALPWMFDIRIPELNQGSRGVPGPNNDIGPAHIEIAASTNGTNWSRPNRTPLITKGTSSTSWDWGFTMTSQGLQVEGNQTLLFYSSYQGEHACTTPDVDGCAVTQSPSRAGLVTWPRDRMVSLHADGTGTLVTRPLTPAVDNGTLTINSTGTVKVGIIDAAGNDVPGYTTSNSTLTPTGDGLTSTVSWTGGSTLPSLASLGGRLRLRITVTGGDIYATTIK